MFAKYEKEYTTEEQFELEIKYSGLVNEILRTDYILFETQRQVLDKIEAVTRRDQTLKLIEANGFSWHFDSELGPRRELQPLLKIWNSEIKFGFNFRIRNSWFS